jgi:hypothetical protein
MVILTEMHSWESLLILSRLSTSWSMESPTGVNPIGEKRRECDFY